MPTFQFGEVVVVDLHSSHGTDPEEVTVIGNLSEEILVVATDKYIGMAVNSCHLSYTGRKDKNAAFYRDRLNSLYPEYLKELT